jgi:outer membrane protein assembly factor BamA
MIRGSLLFLICGLMLVSVHAEIVVNIDTTDSTRELVIRNIIFKGNKITRDRIIQRELTVHVNDSLSVDKLTSELKISQQNVYNTNLFNFVTIDAIGNPENGQIDIEVKVVERWYIWPIPYLQLADRNFNIWFESRDLSRLTYGVDLTFYNVRGKNETLKLLTHFGYNQLYGFNYKIPYLNHRQTIGVKFGFDVEFNHEVAVLTHDNKPVYMKNNQLYLQRKWFAFSELLYRPDYFNTHSFSLQYDQYLFSEQVDTIPGFLVAPDDHQRFLTLRWFFKTDHRDVHDYPLNGHYIDFEINHSIPYQVARNSYVKGNMRFYRHLFNRWYWAAGITGKFTFSKIQPYYLQRGLGYGRDFVRGYEYYVIDGQHFALVKGNVKFALVPQRMDNIRFLRSLKFNVIPWAVYLNVFTDAGFVYHYPYTDNDNYSAGNSLENSFLFGCGVGVDFATYYDVVIRLEAAINGLGQPGLYLHFTAPI